MWFRGLKGHEQAPVTGRILPEQPRGRQRGGEWVCIKWGWNALNYIGRAQQSLRAKNKGRYNIVRSDFAKVSIYLGKII